MKSEFEKLSLRMRAQICVAPGQWTRELTSLDTAATSANDNDLLVATEDARFALSHTPTGAKILAWNLGD